MSLKSVVIVLKKFIVLSIAVDVLISPGRQTTDGRTTLPVKGLRSLGQARLHCGQVQVSSRW